MRITYLEKKSIETKFGPKEKYTMKVQKPDGTEIFCDSWVSNWNKFWKVGEDIHPVKEQWKSREYNGKTYWTLEQLKIDWGNELTKVNQKLDTVLELLGKGRGLSVEKAVDMLGGVIVEEKNEMPDNYPGIPTINLDEEDGTVGTPGHRLSDVPF